LVKEPGSAALKEFEEAAEEFMGEVEFFAVVTSYWAKKVGLKRVGEVQVGTDWPFISIISIQLMRKKCCKIAFSNTYIFELIPSYRYVM
jgi:hypothetical protein